MQNLDCIKSEDSFNIGRDRNLTLNLQRQYGRVFPHTAEVRAAVS